jgi:hypothetical protein
MYPPHLSVAYIDCPLSAITRLTTSVGQGTFSNDNGHYRYRLAPFLCATGRRSPISFLVFGLQTFTVKHSMKRFVARSRWPAVGSNCCAKKKRAMSETSLQQVKRWRLSLRSPGTHPRKKGHEFCLLARVGFAIDGANMCPSCLVGYGALFRNAAGAQSLG